MSTRLLPDWITAYCHYTEETEPPYRYHLWTALSTIAACLQRKCYLDWGHMQIYPNLYVLLVGPPGGRKGTAMKVGKSFLRKLNVPLAAEFMTRPALIQSLEASIKSLAPGTETVLTPGSIVPVEKIPKGSLLSLNKNLLGPSHCSLTIFSEEFAVFLGERNPDMVMTLTDLFDCPDEWNYKTKHSGENALGNAWLNIIGATTPDLLQDALTQSAIGGGLTSRIIFVVEGGKKAKVPLPFLSAKQRELTPKLMADLESILLMRGQFRFCEGAIIAYTNWYMSAEAIHPNVAALSGYNERRALHLLKLSMICSASRSETLEVSEEDFNRALEILTDTERNMHYAFHGIGKNPNAQVLSQLMMYIALKKTVTYDTILDHFKFDVDTKVLQMMLQTLLDMNKVTVGVEKNKMTYRWRVVTE